jgi:TolB protein
MLQRHFALSLFLCVLLFASKIIAVEEDAIGIFTKSQDIGDCGKKGSAKFDEKAYTVTGGGGNMWGAADAFHFACKEMSGDVSVAADLKILGTGGDPHRKACLVIRQNLEPGSPYVDAVLHGDGLSSLQYRETADGPTREIQATIKNPLRLRLEKEGDIVSMSVAPEGESLKAAGGAFKIIFTEPFLIGIGVCAHNNAALETATFSNLEIKQEEKPKTAATILESTLETINIQSTDRRAVYHTRGHFEAPNWSRDGKSLVYNSGGKIFSIPVTGGEPKLIDTGFATRCNNDHGLSPDGKELVISDQSQTDRKSRIYILPSTGGTPRQITPLAPSYWHGWSPDAKILVYCAERHGDYDVYSIPAAGGEEKRLTTEKGLDDGPEYSHDGKYIYFNSVRSGLMQIWRMDADGSNPTQITKDDYNNWFAHPSPDGRWLVFLSYEKDVTGHPANKDVQLRLMPIAGGEIRVLAKLFGGQGTINVPSWSPDSRQVAFVSYRLVHE